MGVERRVDGRKIQEGGEGIRTYKREKAGGNENRREKNRGGRKR